MYRRQLTVHNRAEEQGNGPGYCCRHAQAGPPFLKPAARHAHADLLPSLSTHHQRGPAPDEPLGVLVHAGRQRRRWVGQDQPKNLDCLACSKGRAQGMLGARHACAGP